MGGEGSFLLALFLLFLSSLFLALFFPEFCPSFIFLPLLNALAAEIIVLPFAVCLPSTHQHSPLLGGKAKWLFLQQTLIFTYGLSIHAVSKCGLRSLIPRKICMSSLHWALSSEVWLTGAPSTEIFHRAGKWAVSLIQLCIVNNCKPSKY